MKKNSEIYAIVGRISNNDDMMFLTTSEGVYSWTPSMADLKIFRTYDECLKIIESSEFNNHVKSSNGILYPSYVLHSLSGVNNTKPEETVVINIVKLQFDFTPYQTIKDVKLKN